MKKNLQAKYNEAIAREEPRNLFTRDDYLDVILGYLDNGVTKEDILDANLNSNSELLPYLRQYQWYPSGVQNFNSILDFARLGDKENQVEGLVQLLSKQKANGFYTSVLNIFSIEPSSLDTKDINEYISSPSN